MLTVLMLTIPKDAMTIMHLPNGPTAYFRLTSIELTEEIYVSSILIFTASPYLLN